MFYRAVKIFCCWLLLLPLISEGQYIQKIAFDEKDSTDGFYLAVTPRSGTIKGTVILLSDFYALDGIISETKLHNIAYAYGNDMLTVFASMKQKFYADKPTVDRVNLLIKNIVTKFKADTSRFAIGGFDYAGIIALRYTELCYEHPSEFMVHPKAVFAVASSVDLFDLWHQCERQIKKDYYPGSVGDAKYILDAMTKENGTIYANRDTYSKLSAFDHEQQAAGNERFLKNVAVRVYYDTDIEWQLKNRRNGFYDTDIPCGSELINRLLLQGNENAEFIASKMRGQRSDGMQNPISLSILDETECIKWLKDKLDIFDPATWVAPYNLLVPSQWTTEKFLLPPDFAPKIIYKGIEDLRFTPGWGDTTSEQHWSYSFLWWLEGKPAIDENLLKESLQQYYSGLIARNIPSRKIPESKLVPVVVAIKKQKNLPGDVETYGGIIDMLDYIAQKPIRLNCVIHVKTCASGNYSPLFFEVSPKPASDKIWKDFDTIDRSFNCKK